MIELFRQLGVAQAIETHAPIKQRQRGLRAARLVESLIALWTRGGDRCWDLATVREDNALATPPGYPLPAPTPVRASIEVFHVEGRPLWSAGPQAPVPLSSASLAGLGAGNRTRVTASSRRPGQRPRPSRRCGARGGPHGCRHHRHGTRGDQPVVVPWAEQDSASTIGTGMAMSPLAVGMCACGNRPWPPCPRVWSAFACATVVPGWSEGHEIQYAISADLSAPLKAEIVRLPETAWQVERAEPEALRAWAEVPYVPGNGDRRKDGPCVRRYLAVRIPQRQGRLFADHSSGHYFAVVPNRERDGLSLLQWHWQKTGTVERTHHVLKNELAAAALPRGKFGPNAAWSRLNTLTYSVLSALKRLTLPGDLQTARPTGFGFCRVTRSGRSCPTPGGPFSDSPGAFSMPSSSEGDQEIVPLALV